MTRTFALMLVIAASLLPAATLAESRPAAKPKTAAPAAAGAAVTPARGGGPRKLEDIHIEGQMPAPQVLFITARDQRRFLDFQHARYLRSARDVAAGARMPKRFLVPAHAEPASGEER